jgi:hypothetical protein
MSHNSNKVNAQEPNRQGVLAQALEDLSDVGALGASEGQALGWGAGPTLAAIDVHGNYDIAGSFWISGGGWGGSYAYSVGDAVIWRQGSATITADASRLTFQGGTWISQFTLQAGTYLLKWDLPFSPSAASAYAVIRLKDITNNQYIGPKVKIGDGRSSNHLMCVVAPTAATTYNWEVIAKNGTIALPTATTLRSLQAAFIEEV